MSYEDLESLVEKIVRANSRSETIDELKEQRKQALRADRAAKKELEVEEGLEEGPLTFTPISAVKRPVREWLVKGFWLRGSYGEIAGGEKSFKSYITKAEVVAIASGRPMLNIWPVQTRGSVVVMVGEGGAGQWMWDAMQIAQAMGIGEAEFASLPIYVTEQHAWIDSPRFQEGVAKALDEFKPVLLVIDPLYTYFNNDDSSNLFSAAKTLNAVSNLTQPRGVALQIVNHTKKGQNKNLDLQAITQAGHREWCDSWVIMEKRSEDADEGRFEIQIRVGGRNSGTRFYTLTLDLGPFDIDTLTFEREPKWEIESVNSASTPKVANRGADRGDIIRRTLADHPWEYTSTELRKEVGGKTEETAKIIAEMTQFGIITTKEVERQNAAGRSRKTIVVGPGPSFDMTGGAR